VAVGEALRDSLEGPGFDPMTIINCPYPSSRIRSWCLLRDSFEMFLWSRARPVLEAYILAATSEQTV
jgi:hypothetical protein